MIYQDGNYYVEAPDGGYARLPSPLDHLVRPLPRPLVESDP